MLVVVHLEVVSGRVAGMICWDPEQLGLGCATSPSLVTSLRVLSVHCAMLLSP